MTFKAKYTWLFPLFIASICFSGDAFSFNNEERCTTEGKSGSCMVIPECEHAIDIIKQYGVSSTESQNFLKLNQCGFKGKIPKICCHNNENIVDSRNAFKQAVSPEDNKKEIDGSEMPVEKNPYSLLPTQCGAHISLRIMGGEDTKLSEFPWMVALEYEETGTKDPIIGCGGSLISKRYVLTAAHCIRTTSNVRLTNVRLGEHNISRELDCEDVGKDKRICAKPIISVPIESKIVHEDFMSPELYRNDIALLRLAYDVPISDYIQPICLPFSSDTEKFYWSAGWGETETKRNSDVKLKILLPYFNFKHCEAKYRTKKIILGKGQMCAGGQAAKDTCRGDSGAPLMKKVQQVSGDDLWIVDGVLSFGTRDCGLAKWPAVYTKVYDYLPWILSKLRS